MLRVGSRGSRTDTRIYGGSLPEDYVARIPLRLIFTRDLKVSIKLTQQRAIPQSGRILIPRSVSLVYSIVNTQVSIRKDETWKISRMTSNKDDDLS